MIVADVNCFTLARTLRSTPADGSCRWRALRVFAVLLAVVCTGCVASRQERRTTTGGNGPNFVFKLEGGGVILVYHNCWDEEQNRLELKEVGGEHLLFSYCHTGLATGPPGRYRWDGTRFVRLD